MVVDYQKDFFNTDDSVLMEHMKKNNVSQKMMDNSLDQLVSWFNMQPHLPRLNKDDSRLLRILSINDYSIEKCKKKMENLFTARTMMPEYFIDRDLRKPEIKKFADIVEIVILPKLTPEKHRIVITRLNNGDVDLFDPIILHKINFMLADFRLYYDTIYDDVYILDFSHTTIQHGIKMNPTFLKRVTHLSQECYNTKIKSIHLLNVPSYLQTLISLAKSLMKKKIADRIQTHADWDTLHKFIPKDCIPSDFGGTAGSMKEHKAKLLNCVQSDEWIQKYKTLENEKSDESKRPEGSKTNFDFSDGCVEGSFRTLDFD